MKVILECGGLFAAQVEPCLLVPLLIVDFLYSILFDVGAIDGFGVVVGNLGCFGSLCYGVVVVVDQANQLATLLIGDLDVLSDHGKLKLLI